MLPVDRHVRIERIGLEDHGDAALGGRQLVDPPAADATARRPVIVSSPAMMRSSVDLPQPEGPTKTHELAVLDLEVDVVQDLDGAEGLGDAAKGDVGPWLISPRRR